MADISVVICVRNGERYLQQALDSVSAQDLGNLEIVVVDDGSTDGTSEIATRHALRPRVINRPASGLPASINAGLEACSRSFISFLDADDVWPRDRLQVMLRTFGGDPAPKLVYGQIVNTDEFLKPIQAPFATRNLTCSLVRRETFATVGALRTDVAHAANVDWMSRAIEMQIPMMRLDSIVLLRRIHGDNMGLRDTIRGRQDLLRVVRDHRVRSANA